MRTVRKTGDPVKAPTVRTSSGDTKSILESQGKTVSEQKGATVRAVNIVRPSNESEKKTPSPTPPPPKGESKTPTRRKPKPPKIKKPKTRARRVKAQYGKGLGTKGNKTGRGGKTFSGRRTGRRGGKF